MKPALIILFLLLLSLSIYVTSSASSSPIPTTNFSSSTTCPMDLGYVRRIPWVSSDCHNYPNPKQVTDTKTQDSCCQTLQSVYFMALAQRLRETSLFLLPNLSTSISCLSDFQSNLTSLSLSSNLTSLCFNPLQFVITPNTCASIESTQDWIAKLGPSTPLDSGCRPDLTNLTACEACITAGSRVQSDLIAIDGNKSHSTQCFYFVIMYAAGIINEIGPGSSGTIRCIVGLSSGSQPVSRNKHLVFGLIGASIGAFIIIVMAIGIWNWFIRKKKKKNIEEDGDDYFDQVSGLPMRFSYEELKVATRNFQTKLGEGGFGSVFEGNLGNGEKIAVKRVDGLGQGKKEFLAEVKTIGSVHQVNLVRLIGFCAENLHRLLVYEFMANGSLDRWIFTRNGNLVQPALDWQARRKIILDIAKGLAYLHEECRQRIVHLDIKPQNILLDSNLHAKVSDFGLSKLIERDQSQIITTMRGTPGYLAPEWLNSVITEKADVYSFGIVVMEMVCGRKNLDRSQPEECMHLLKLFMRKAVENQLIDMVDKNSCDMQLHGLEVVEMMKLGIWCLQHDCTRRPSMSMVVKVIEGTMDVEPNLDYGFTNMTTLTTIKDSQFGTKATLLPSILSGPR